MATIETIAELICLCGFIAAVLVWAAVAGGAL